MIHKSQSAPLFESIPPQSVSPQPVELENESKNFQEWLLGFKKELQMTLMTKLGFELREEISSNEENSEAMEDWIEYGYAEMFANLFEEYTLSILNFTHIKDIFIQNKGREELLEKLEDEFAPELYKQMEIEVQKKKEQKITDKDILSVEQI